MRAQPIANPGPVRIFCTAIKKFRRATRGPAYCALDRADVSEVAVGLIAS
jgi:hypothetical protein